MSELFSQLLERTTKGHVPEFTADDLLTLTGLYGLYWEAGRRSTALDVEQLDQLLCLAALTGLEVGCSFVAPDDPECGVDGFSGLLHRWFTEQALLTLVRDTDSSLQARRGARPDLQPPPLYQVALADLFNWAPVDNRPRLRLYAQVAVLDALLHRLGNCDANVRNVLHVHFCNHGFLECKQISAIHTIVARRRAPGTALRVDKTAHAWLADWLVTGETRW